MSRAAGTYAIFETSQGNIVIRLLEKEAPKTVENFVGLAEGTKEFTNEKTGKKEKRNFYDGLTFHRVIPQFMIQGGCPEGTGRGGPGYKFADEFHPSLKHSKAGKFRWPTPGREPMAANFLLPWRRRRGWITSTPYLAKWWKGKTWRTRFPTRRAMPATGRRLRLP